MRWGFIIGGLAQLILGGIVYRCAFRVRLQKRMKKWVTHPNNNPIRNSGLLNRNCSEQFSEHVRERITQHEQASYDNFRLFLTLSTAIIGALGYLALEKSDPWEMICWLVVGLLILESLVGLVFLWTLCLEWEALFGHWHNQYILGLKHRIPNRLDALTHIQLPFAIIMILIPTFLWMTSSFIFARSGIHLQPSPHQLFRLTAWF